MRRLVAAALLLLLLCAAGLAQGVNVIGAVTPGHCVSFFSTSQIQDSGGTCGGGGGGGITGPGSSTVGDLAVWNNATGSALADTGLAFPGGFTFAGTLTGATAVTFPTAGTLATTATANVASVTGTTGQVTVTPTTGAVVASLPATITANLTLSGTINHTGAVQIGGNTMTFPAVTANIGYLVGTPVTGNCVKFSGTVGGITDSGGVCGGGGGTPGGANTNVQFNNSSAFGGDAGFTYAGAGQVTHALGTITTNLKALTITGTWNAVGTTFDAPLFMNIINTASAAGSSLLDLQIGGVSKLTFATSGGSPQLNFGAATASFPGFRQESATTIGIVLGDGSAYAGIVGAQANFGPGTLINGTQLVLGATTGQIQFGGPSPLLTKDAAQIIAIRDFTVNTPSTLRVYNTADGGTNAPTNSERGVLDWTTVANTLTIGSQAGGTGTNRAVLLASSIGASLSLATAKVVTVGDGAANANGWLQWGGEARVTSDFSVTSSVALVNVTGLTVNVAAGRTYQFTTELYVTDAAAGGVQAAIAGTATATAIQYTGYTIADNLIKAKTNGTALAAAVGSTVTTETAGIIVRITGTITVNAAGTLTVQMAQNTSNGTATIAKRGSWFLVNDMP